MAVKKFILLVMTSTLVAGQRPSFAGSRPIGYPEMVTSTTESLGNRFGEGDATTQRLPIEANGDRDLIDRLSKLPVDKQPFWFINWQAYESHRQKPQSFPQKPNTFIDPALNIGATNSQNQGNFNQQPANNNDQLENRFNVDSGPQSNQFTGSANNNPVNNYPTGQAVNNANNQPAKNPQIIQYPNGQTVYYPSGQTLYYTNGQPVGIPVAQTAGNPKPQTVQYANAQTANNQVQNHLSMDQVQRQQNQYPTKGNNMIQPTVPSNLYTQGMLYPSTRHANSNFNGMLGDQPAINTPVKALTSNNETPSKGTRQR